jgi:hypothetical protein
LEKQHDFNASYAAGIVGETFLDDLFAKNYEVKQVSREDQRKGIDRYFTNRKNNKTFSVEYKTDYRAAETGNAFIETVSVDSAGKVGWAEKSQAKYLVYYIPQLNTIYCLELSAIREQLTRWTETYPTRTARNDGYSTHGVLVPLDELRTAANWVEQC